MWTPQYFVRYARLPLSIEGVALPNDDGSFDIYINSLLPEDRQADRLQHEIRHIQADHFYKEACPVAQIEAEANGLSAGSGLAQKESGNAPCAAEGATAQSAAVPPAAPGGTPVPRLPDVFGDAPAGRIPCFTDIAQFLQYFLALNAQRDGKTDE